MSFARSLTGWEAIGPMPELPEAEVVARQLRQRLLGAVWKDCWVGRPDIVRQGFETLESYRSAHLTAVERVGKSVVLTWVRDRAPGYLVAELGMTGLLLFGSPADHYRKHTHVVLSLDGVEESELRYWN